MCTHRGTSTKAPKKKIFLGISAIKCLLWEKFQNRYTSNLMKYVGFKCYSKPTQTPYIKRKQTNFFSWKVFKVTQTVRLDKWHFKVPSSDSFCDDFSTPVHFLLYLSHNNGIPMVEKVFFWSFRKMKKCCFFFFSSFSRKKKDK